MTAGSSLGGGNGLSPAAIGGIVGGVLGGLLLICIAVICLMTHIHQRFVATIRSRYPPPPPIAQPPYNTDPPNWQRPGEQQPIAPKNTDTPLTTWISSPSLPPREQPMRLFDRPLRSPNEPTPAPPYASTVTAGRDHMGI